MNFSPWTKYRERLFFSLVEFDLAKDFKSNIRLNRREELISFIINIGGIVGVIAVYMIMVMRKTTINLPIFNEIAIIDLKGKLILRKQMIASEHSDLQMERRHFPSLEIIFELANAYRLYNKYRTNEYIDRGFQHPAESNFSASSKNSKISDAMAESTRDASLNKYYVLRLVFFYIHRSIIFANSKKILSNAKSVVTVNEFTAQIVGYLSALSDLGLPLTLYIATRTQETHLKYISLAMFTQIIVNYGSHADKIRTNYDGPVYVERKITKTTKFEYIPPLKIGVFLASYYTLSNEECTNYGKNYVIPFLKEILTRFSAENLVVHCHPSDLRLNNLLETNGISLNALGENLEYRMLNYDIVFCGNTTVVEEALMLGVPVIYNGALDTYKHDLFGYVQSGIVIDATNSTPSLDEVCNYYNNPIFQAKLQNFICGSNKHEFIDFVDAIINVAQRKFVVNS